MSPPPGAIVVADPDPSWPRLFEQLRAPIWALVGTFAVGIEHVGSTSVPGLAAKPTIDMDIVVEGEGDILRAIAALANLGYTHRGDLGIHGREAFYRPQSLPPHNLYVCQADSLALANHLAIRDHLRKSPAKVAEYADLKRRLARQFPHDIGSYIEGKTAFLVSLMREAGFSTSDIADVVSMNRKPG